MKKNEFILVFLLMSAVSLGCNFSKLLNRSPETNQTFVNGNSNSNRVAGNVSNRNSSDPPTADEKIYKVMADKANELGRTQTTVKLDPNALVKGKVAVVAKKYEFSEDYEIEGFNVYKTDFATEYDLNNLALTKERMAVKPDEIETLVRISCNQGKVIGRFVSPTGNRSVPAHSMVCKVSIIDLKAKTVIAQKTLENKTMEESASVADGDTKHVNLAPWKEIEKYLKSFPVA